MGHTCKAEGLDTSPDYLMYAGSILGKITSVVITFLQAAFIPTSESDLDTSYFTSRLSWDPSDEHFFPTNEAENSTDDDSRSGSSSCPSNQQDEQVFWSRNLQETKAIVRFVLSTLGIISFTCIFS